MVGPGARGVVPLCTVLLGRVKPVPSFLFTFYPLVHFIDLAVPVWLWGGFGIERPYISMNVLFPGGFLGEHFLY